MLRDTIDSILVNLENTVGLLLLLYLALSRLPFDLGLYLGFHSQLYFPHAVWNAFNPLYQDKRFRLRESSHTAPGSRYTSAAPVGSEDSRALSLFHVL